MLSRFKRNTYGENKPLEIRVRVPSSMLSEPLIVNGPFSSLIFFHFIESLYLLSLKSCFEIEHKRLIIYLGLSHRGFQIIYVPTNNAQLSHQ